MINTMITACEQCNRALPLLARKHARYCSGRCRTAACRSRCQVPAELTTQDRWVRYSDRKVPLTVDGKPASSTNPDTWTDHTTAAASTVGVGAGFVLNGDGIACIDLDHCITNGQLAPWAAGILTQLPDTYVEVSPSGTGLHIWGYGTVGTGRKIRRADGACIEIYDHSRYITVTGKRYTSSRHLADISEVIAQQHRG